MRRCWNFDRPKPEEAEIRQLFALTKDNMTGKEMAVLIMIHYRPYLHDDSHIRLFHLSGRGLVPLWPDKSGPTVYTYQLLEHAAKRLLCSRTREEP